MHWLSPTPSYKSEIWTLIKKDKKTIDINRDDIFQNSRVHPSLPQNEGRTSLGETKKIQIKMSTPCNKNEQQQEAKNNAEL